MATELMKKIICSAFLLLALNAGTQPFIPSLKKNGYYVFLDSATGGFLPGLESQVFLWPQANGLLTVQKDLLFGCIDRTGRMVVPNQFSTLNDFSEGRALAMDEKGYYFIDPTGKMISARYSYARDFRNGYALVARRNKYGFINREGREVVPLVYDLPHLNENEDEVDDESLGGGFSEGLATAWKGEKVGFVNGAGKLIIPAQFDWAEPFHEGLALVTRNEKSGFIDKSGKIVIPLQFASAGYFTEGLVWTYRAGQADSIIYFDKGGKRAFAGAWRRAEGFSGGLAAVQVNNAWGFINKQGALEIPARFASVGTFIDGYCEAANEAGYWGLIDTKGNWVIQPVYSTLNRLAKGYYRAEKEDTAFCVGINGKEWRE